MDPTVALSTMTDPENDAATRAVAALDLLLWLARGGFTPIPSGAEGIPVDVVRLRLLLECENLITAALDLVPA